VDRLLLHLLLQARDKQPDRRRASHPSDILLDMLTSKRSEKS
jgi:hypothetical protein